jgi:hypothetical protein
VGLAPGNAFSVLPMTLRDDLLSAFNEIVKNSGNTGGSLQS